MYEYFDDGKHVHLITELCKGGEMFDKIIEKEFFEEGYACKIFKQVLQAINYCHKVNIVHRDLKPENFLFETKDDDSDIKIIDFGLSKLVKQKATGKIEKCTTQAGTPYYIAPDVLTGSYDKSVDLWSAGCILYVILCGYPPFSGDTDQEILDLVQKAKFDFEGEEWEDVSKHAKDLIKKLITTPERRLTAEEALDHKWFKLHKGDKKDIPGIKKKNLKALKSYVHCHKLHQAAMTAIAVQASPKDTRDLKNLFIAIDQDGSGSISLNELETALGHKEEHQCLKKLLIAADTDNSG